MGDKYILAEAQKQLQWGMWTNFVLKPGFNLQFAFEVKLCIFSQHAHHGLEGQDTFDLRKTHLNQHPREKENQKYNTNLYNDALISLQIKYSLINLVHQRLHFLFFL